MTDDGSYDVVPKKVSFMCKINEWSQEARIVRESERGKEERNIKKKEMRK